MCVCVLLTNVSAHTHLIKWCATPHIMNVCLCTSYQPSYYWYIEVQHALQQWSSYS